MTLYLMFVYQMCLFKFKNRDNFWRRKNIHHENSRSTEMFYSQFVRTNKGATIGPNILHKFS